MRKNFTWTLTGNVIYAACQWGMLVSIAKLGTASMLGQFAFGLAVSAPVFMLTSLHLRMVLASDAQNEYRLGHFLAPRLLGIATALILISTYVCLSHFDRDTCLVILLVSAAKAVEMLSDIIQGFWQKHERFDKIAIALVGRGLGSVAIMALTLYYTRNIIMSTAATALYWFLWLVIYERRTAENLLKTLCPLEILQAEWDMDKCRRLVSLGLPLSISMLLLSLNTNIPRYFVGHYWGNSALGHFAAMAYVFVAGNTVIAAMGQSATPRLARHFHCDRSAFARLLTNMILVGAIIGVFGVAVAFLCGPTLLRVLYRADYAQYARVFTWLMAAGAFAYVGSMLGYGMVAARIFRPQVPLFLGVTAVTAFACWLLIPRLGLAGSAYAILIGSIFSCIGSAYFIFSRLRSRPDNVSA